eukprot:COSAG06_NODE_2671_length_6467_cov_46.974560_5_plen_92_part_00
MARVGVVDTLWQCTLEPCLKVEAECATWLKTRQWLWMWLNEKFQELNDVLIVLVLFQPAKRSGNDKIKCAPRSVLMEWCLRIIGLSASKGI